MVTKLISWLLFPFPAPPPHNCNKSQVVTHLDWQLYLNHLVFKHSYPTLWHMDTLLGRPRLKGLVQPQTSLGALALITKLPHILVLLTGYLLTGWRSCGDLLTPDDNFAVSATSPLGKIPSANQTLLCSLGHTPREQ